MENNKINAEKLKLHTLDHVQENVNKIATLFPNCLTERINKEGELEHVIDFDKLKQELSDYVVESSDERYQFTWPNKKNAILLANAPISKTLRPCREESVNFDDTENLYIEGDNLDVLKILQETYLNKIKMIYIDPPYNTGNDFVYEDDFAQSVDEYKEISGDYDEEGNRLFKNTDTNGRFHTDWLNMIYPRLKLAKNLLAEDGVIFISIDDNEVHNLRKICDEIFGASNFVGIFLWEKRINRENRKEISIRHDYIVCYTKNRMESRAIGLLPMNEDAISRYKNPDNDPRGIWTSVPAIAQAGHGTKTQFYQITTPSGRTIDPPSGSCWRYTKIKMDEAIADNRIWFGSDGTGVPRIKKFITEGQQGLTVESIWFAREVGTNDTAKREITKLFLGKAIFETPKPSTLMQQMLSISSDKDSIILDFFSGSATTAHAVMQLNAEDGGNRKFICVQLPEKTDEKSEAFKAGYKNICEIGKERIRRAGAKIKEDNKDKENIDNLDIGFRVLKVDSANTKEGIYTRPVVTTQGKLLEQENNIKDDRTPEDLLFQAMLQLGVTLSHKIEESTIAGKNVFMVNYPALIACFDENVTEEVITEIAKKKPLFFVMRDSSMASDSVAVNFDNIFKQYSDETKRLVL